MGALRRGLPVPYGYRMADTILQARACGGSREIRQSPLPEIHAPERIRFRTRRGGFRKLARPCRSQTAREWPIPGLGKKPRSSY